ncbi:hypothetical protein COCON_G00031580 [Conger conger]|uniref:non-specific serine/threonine protein kinase n=1 Tax=Conger conger TaxID=82655 RepID=A0A9Q1I7A6_CONCO|nr:hypothetical protein COCON_G00031580 [Conger conger]
MQQHTPLPPSLYDPCKSQSFFSQCFINLGLLGRGSFGVVYKVLSLQDGQHYAIKRSVQRFRGDRDRQRSVREARNHECLCPHPHILGFKAAWEETGHLYIQTELCCTSLLMHTEAQPHSPEESVAWAYLCDLLSALQHLHSRGFVHLDLKPANVFMTRSGRLKLGDFGLLLELAGERRGQLGGTEGEEKEEGQEGDPRYMAPELLRGEYTPAADVFSLGVSILELACNMEVPKGGDGWQQLRQGNLPSAFVNGLSGDLIRPYFSFADTGSLEEDVVFLPEEMGPKYSPTLFHRTKSLVFVGGTSTPHPKTQLLHGTRLRYLRNLPTMSKIERLNARVAKLLTVAVHEVLEVVRETVSEYQEKTARTQRENESLRRRLQELQDKTKRANIGASLPVIRGRSLIERQHCYKLIVAA